MCPLVTFIQLIVNVTMCQFSVKKVFWITHKEIRFCKDACSSTPPWAFHFDNRPFIETAHRGEAKCWNGKTVYSGGVGMRGQRGRGGWRGGGCVEATGLQRILKTGGTQVTIRFAVSCFNKAQNLLDFDQLWPEKKLLVLFTLIHAC